MPDVVSTVNSRAVAPLGIGAFAVGTDLFVVAGVLPRSRCVTGMGPAPLLLALNSSAIHLGFATGALLGGLVVDAAGVGSLWSLPVMCCGAGLVLHGILTQEVRS